MCHPAFSPTLTILPGSFVFGPISPELDPESIPLISLFVPLALVLLALAYILELVDVDSLSPIVSN